MWRSRRSAKSINKLCGESRASPRATQPANSLRPSWDGEGNGEGSRNLREKSWDDAVVRLARRGASGDRAAGGAMRGHAAQVADQRRIRRGTDRLGGIRERVAPDATYA